MTLETGTGTHLLPPLCPPLAGVVVVDLADECLALAGRLLADLGATVVRPESLAGDEIRRRGPFVDNIAGRERSLAHLHYNGGKASLAVDLGSPRAWDLIERLTAVADLVIAPLEKRGAAVAYFDHARFARAHPGVGLVDVIFRRGHLEQRGSDLIAAASGGLLYCNGFPDRAPDYPAGKLAYKQASINAAAAAAALVLGRQRHGLGGIASVSLEEAVMSTLIQAANQNLWTWYGAVGKRAGLSGLSYPVLGKGGTVALLSGSNATFATADDRWVVFGMTPFTLQRWDTFVAWLKELTGDTTLVGSQWHDADYRAAHRAAVSAGMRALCRQLPRDVLATEGQARGLMVVPVNTVADIAADEHLAARYVFYEVNHSGVGRRLPAIRSPFRSTAWEPRAGVAPRLGEHTSWALGLAGCTSEETEELRGLGIVETSPPAETPAEPGPLRPRVVSRPPRPETLPLAGYRVVDFCWQAAGPLTTEVLANLGADVIKIESMKRVDTVRLYSHPIEHFSIDTGAFFNDCNTGKRSVTLNLGTAEGLDIARRLIAGADVVTSNFTPGQMDDWGLGYASLREIKQDVVVLTLPVMGESGPKRGWRGIGNSVVAMAGLAWHTGCPDRPPIGLGTLQTDFTVPLFGAMAVISALRQRELTGEGQHIEVAQYESALQLLDTELLDYLVNGTVAERAGNRSRFVAPHGVYPCAGDDRWVAIEAATELEWQQLAWVIGRVDLGRRTDLRSIEGRIAAGDEINEAITEWTRVRSPEMVERELQEAGVLAGALRHIGDLVECPDGLEEFLTTVDHPAGLPLTVQNQPFSWNGRRLAVSRAPLLGEHNHEVLQTELGIDEETLVGLMVKEVVI